MRPLSLPVLLLALPLGASAQTNVISRAVEAPHGPLLTLGTVTDTAALNCARHERTRPDTIQSGDFEGISLPGVWYACSVAPLDGLELSLDLDAHRRLTNIAFLFARPEAFDSLGGPLSSAYGSPRIAYEDWLAWYDSATYIGLKRLGLPPGPSVLLQWVDRRRQVPPGLEQAN
jgi:hypothetical protein